MFFVNTNVSKTRRQIKELERVAALLCFLETLE